MRIRSVLERGTERFLASDRPASDSETKSAGGALRPLIRAILAGAGSVENSNFVQSRD